MSHFVDAVFFKFTSPKITQLSDKYSLTINIQYFSLAAAYFQDSFSAPFKFIILTRSQMSKTVGRTSNYMTYKLHDINHRQKFS